MKRTTPLLVGNIAYAYLVDVYEGKDKLDEVLFAEERAASVSAKRERAKKMMKAMGGR